MVRNIGDPQSILGLTKMNMEKFPNQLLSQILMIESKNEFTPMNLPKRRKGSYLKSMRKSNLLTNLYKVDFDQSSTILIYSVKTLPEIALDSTQKLNSIMNCARKNLEPFVGNNFALCGRTLYSCHLNEAIPKKEQIEIQSKEGNDRYTVSLKLVKQVKMSNICSPKHKQAMLPLNFMNNLLKRFFSQMNYIQVGKGNKYVNPGSRKVIQNAGIVLFTGYETSFNMLESGLYLRVDSITRIVQDKTVLEFINSIYMNNSHLNKDQKRGKVQEEMIGKTVMANYGNSRYWIVQEVVFDVNFETLSIDDNSSMTLTEYYLKNYGMRINNKKQPLLKAVINGSSSRKVAKQAILVPEFLLMSGLPDDFDERKRRDISQHTIIEPSEKLKRIETLIRSFNQDIQNFSPNNVSKSLGVTISSTTESIDAVSLNPPVLQLGKGKAVESHRVASFMLFDKQIYSNSIPVNVLAIIPNDFDFMQIEKLFASTCKNLGISYRLNPIKINFRDSSKAMRQIQSIIIDKNGQFDDMDLNWFILPGSLKSQYRVIKQLSSQDQNPKVTQVTLTTTLGKKGFASILTKILLQISSKVGNVPWAPKISSSLGNKIMLVGIDHRKDKLNPKMNVVAYCSTTNKELTKFNSNYYYQPRSSETAVQLNNIMADCLSIYGKVNNFLPEEIIVLKAGCSEGQKHATSNKQVKDSLNLFQEMNGYSPKLTYINVNKTSSQKFFAQTNRGTSNPSHGTLINSKIVSNNYDFYLVSQHCNKGTVKPAHYQVLYCNSNLQEGVLQELMYTQSFNYMNWTGSVRVPSVLQYATKLCNFIGEHLNKNPDTSRLNDHLFFI